MSVEISKERKVDRDVLLRQLTAIQYQRNNFDFKRGTFRVRGDVVEIFPAYEEDRAVRVELFEPGSVSFAMPKSSTFGRPDGAT